MADWNVVVKLRVMPEGVETDLDGIQEKIRSLAKGAFEVHSMEVKPIAFGLKALEVNLLFNDAAGGMDETQEAVKNIGGVSEVETLDVNRL